MKPVRQCLFILLLLLCVLAASSAASVSSAAPTPIIQDDADLLTDAGIPFLKKDRGGGTAMRIITGANRYGTDLYVPTERLEEAKQLLESTPVETVEENDGEDSEEP